MSHTLIVLSSELPDDNKCMYISSSVHIYALNILQITVYTVISNCLTHLHTHARMHTHTHNGICKKNIITLHMYINVVTKRTTKYTYLHVVFSLYVTV